MNICNKYIRCLSKTLKDDQNINDSEDFVLPFENIEIVSYINRQCHSFLFKTRQKSTANTTNWKAVIPRVGEDEEWGSPGFKKAAEQQGCHSTYNLRHTQLIIYSEFSNSEIRFEKCGCEYFLYYYFQSLKIEDKSFEMWMNKQTGLH